MSSQTTTCILKSTVLVNLAINLQRCLKTFKQRYFRLYFYYKPKTSKAMRTSYVVCMCSACLSSSAWSRMYQGMEG